MLRKSTPHWQQRIIASYNRLHPGGQAEVGWKAHTVSPLYAGSERPGYDRRHWTLKSGREDGPIAAIRESGNLDPGGVLSFGATDAGRSSDVFVSARDPFFHSRQPHDYRH